MLTYDDVCSYCYICVLKLLLAVEDAPLLLGEHAEAGVVGIVSDILAYPEEV